MPTPRPTALRHFAAWALRHGAAELGLAPDADGWVRLDDLAVVASTRLGGPVSAQVLHDALAHGGPRGEQRFALDSAAMRARAAYGHSASQPVTLPPATPPAVLYHATTSAALPTILADGLRPRARQHVHLTTQAARAHAAATRQGAPVLLHVAAAAAHAAGVIFYAGGDDVWLADAIPPLYLRVIDLPA